MDPEERLFEKDTEFFVNLYEKKLKSSKTKVSKGKKLKTKRLKIQVSKMMTPGYIAMADNGFWATSLYKKVALRNLTKLIQTEV